MDSMSMGEWIIIIIMMVVMAGLSFVEARETEKKNNERKM